MCERTIQCMLLNCAINTQLSCVRKHILVISFDDMMQATVILHDKYTSLEEADVFFFNKKWIAIAINCGHPFMESRDADAAKTNVCGLPSPAL